MTSMISEGVEVSVESFYQPDYSNPISAEFMFAYRITIENHNQFPVKLLRRHWHIFDSNGQNREVEGEGVVGVQPRRKTKRLDGRRTCRRRTRNGPADTDQKRLCQSKTCTAHTGIVVRSLGFAITQRAKRPVSTMADP